VVLQRAPAALSPSGGWDCASSRVGRARLGCNKDGRARTTSDKGKSDYGVDATDVKAGGI